MSKKRKRIQKIIIIGLVIITLFLLAGIIYGDQKEELAYNQVVTYVKTNEILKIEARQNSLEIVVTLKDQTERKAVVPSMEEFASFISEEIENGSEMEFVVKKPIQISFSSLLLISSMFFMYNMPKMMSKTGDYKVEQVESKVRFSDIAGIDEEKEQLEETVEFLKNPQKYTSMGARIPKGILLNGEPGTGKTLLAKAIAGEAGVPFFQLNGSSFEEKFVGVGASRVRELFKKAKANAPCIIFIDEIDSVAKKRYADNDSKNEQTLNQFLAEMDGFNSTDNVIVIAATNHVEVLDSALTRAGRFDRHIFIPMPDVLAREKILQIHARNKQFCEDVSLLEIARKTVGFSGADLENVLNEAAIISVNNGMKKISNDIIDEAIARVLVGLKKKNAAITDADKYLTAVHEAGHAIVSAVLRPDVKNFGISIVPRGKSGGYNFFDESDKIYYRKTDLINQIKVLYAGRVAEELVFGDISSGASNDLEKATKIANLMITRLAMDDGLITKISGESNFNNELDSNKMKVLEKICKDAYNDVSTIVTKHKEQLLELASLLMEKEYLSQEDVEKFMLEKL